MPSWTHVQMLQMPEPDVTFPDPRLMREPAAVVAATWEEKRASHEATAGLWFTAERMMKARAIARVAVTRRAFMRALGRQRERRGR